MRGLEILFAWGICFPSLNIVATSPTNSNARSLKLATRYGKLEIVPYNSAISILSLTNSNFLRKRDDDILGDGWSMHMIHADAFLPTENAAADLINFYTYVLDEVIRYSDLDRPEYKGFALTQGRLALNWWCAQMPIPWSLVHTFALEMLRATFRGYAGQFAMRFTHVGGIAIDVVLQVGPFAVQALGMAHGPVGEADSGGTSGGSS